MAPIQSSIFKSKRMVLKINTFVADTYRGVLCDHLCLVILSKDMVMIYDDILLGVDMD